MGRNIDFGSVCRVTEAFAERWGVLSDQWTLMVEPIKIVDGIIVATALEHDLTLVTRNVKVAGFGVLIFNPLGRKLR
jgi:predicted nucleic acid-binding protein